MKKIILTILSISVCTCILNATTSGKAIIPYWFKSSINDTSIIISNISNSNVDVYITLYDRDGNIYNEASESGDNINPIFNWTSDPTDSSGATLSPQKTAQLALNSTGERKFGYGVIEWVSSSSNQVALIAHVMQNHVNDDLTRYARTIIPVNDSKPF